MNRILSTIVAVIGLGLLSLFPLSAQAGDKVIASGQFTGASDHVTTGGVSVVTAEDGTYIVLGEDFSLDGAPDPHVSLGKAGTYDPATESGLLKNLTGPGRYKLPAGVDASAYDEVYIWCVKFSVPLGVAKLN